MQLHLANFSTPLELTLETIPENAASELFQFESALDDLLFY